MRRIDKQYLKTPFYGSRKMAKELGIIRTRAQRRMRMYLTALRDTTS